MNLYMSNIGPLVTAESLYNIFQGILGHIKEVKIQNSLVVSLETFDCRLSEIKFDIILYR